MKKLLPLSLLILLIGALVVIGSSTTATTTPEQQETAPQPEPSTPIPTTPTSTPIPIPTPKIFNTTLWKYTGDCTNSGFIGSCNPRMYITPNNEVIEYYSSQMEIINGKLTWKENNPLEFAGLFSSIYVSDQKLFNKDDYWQNPDYYLTHNLTGDCEDSAFAVASILENKGIKTKVVGGWLTENGDRARDMIVEYKYNNMTYYYFGGILMAGSYSKEVYQQKVQSGYFSFEPVLMFTKNSYYERYRDDW